MKNIVHTFVQWYKRLPEKKHHIEFLTAILSVPVMLTVIILNLNNLNQQKSATQKQSTDGKIVPIEVIINNPSQVVSSPTSFISNTPPSCIKEIGPISILFPRENEVVTKNPVCITIAAQSSYCPPTWSYRLDNGDWSDYTDKNICIHNVMNGNRTMQLRIKSTASDDTITLQRSFVYQGNDLPTTEPTNATTSARLK